MSGAKQKPAAKLAIKPANGGGERVYIAAAWRRDDGRIGGMRLDRKVKQLAVQMEDGTIHRVKVGDDGKTSHFIDLFLEEDRPAGQQQTPRGGFGGGGGYGGKPPADDFDDSDHLGGDDWGGDAIPFDRIRGEVL